MLQLLIISKSAACAVVCEKNIKIIINNTTIYMAS